MATISVIIQNVTNEFTLGDLEKVCESSGFKCECFNPKSINNFSNHIHMILKVPEDSRYEFTNCRDYLIEKLSAYSSTKECSFSIKYDDDTIDEVNSECYYGTVYIAKKYKAPRHNKNNRCDIRSVEETMKYNLEKYKQYEDSIGDLLNSIDKYCDDDIKEKIGFMDECYNHAMMTQARKAFEARLKKLCLGDEE